MAQEEATGTLGEADDPRYTNPPTLCVCAHCLSAKRVGSACGNCGQKTDLYTAEQLRRLGVAA